MAEMRKDDFLQRSNHLQNMTDEELDRYFWELAEKIVDPLIELARTHTSPSIERSVLLRMGFNSFEARAIVEKVFDLGLLGKGAGHIVYRAASELRKPVLETGKELASGEHWDIIERLFKGVKE
ncbi:ornithine aminomutase [Kosmotoga arenicorallina S304]|uniref:Ornithine aminomutase n=1 Tax=Kosmotoga arenicorallina S304 TaxID=1453497 RepID=A0A182C8K2_9BACT|nr:ornithine aminomutase subunit alpha [Kosmotoga arenicorallina]OAA31863.1 ornithine aminomutase [Kosmotoga arenicorallina S304]